MLLNQQFAGQLRNGGGLGAGNPHPQACVAPEGGSPRENIDAISAPS